MSGCLSLCYSIFASSFEDSRQNGSACLERLATERLAARFVQFIEGDQSVFGKKSQDGLHAEALLRVRHCVLRATAQQGHNWSHFVQPSEEVAQHHAPWRSMHNPVP